ncbi:alpha/beta fold hydrolase [Qipengyuania sp. MTN3-11]|uniref:alpha/beta fold hydrolase n=1 Tax=Qipengyuania sp. MTN3-11 TaxID=3056557 RepID=UPI0036F1ACA0
MDAAFTERTWTSADGLELHFRDYPGPDDRPPVICLHGLTRNARDFDALAEHLSPSWRVIAPDMRGRGKSDYAPDSASYSPTTYVADLMRMLEVEGIGRFVAIGTSMGGLMTLLVAGAAPDRIAGAVLNDIGPEVDSAGLDKIKTYVGQGRSFATWMHAARSLEEVHGEAHPTYTLDDWLVMAKRSMTLCSNGRIAFDYDMKIAEPILEAEEAAVPPDLWPLLEGLRDKPVLLVRGELSDILSAQTLARMQQALPQARTVTVPGAGHAPTLDEPEVRAAIDSLLAEVA